MANKIGEILLGLGYVKEEDLKRALDVQRTTGGTRRIGEILLEMFLNEDELLEALSAQSEIPLATDEQYPDVLPIEKLSFDFLRENLILPLALSDNTLDVVIADPSETGALGSIKASFQYDLRTFLASGPVIMQHIERLEGSKDVVLERLLDDVSEDETPREAGDLSHLRDLAEDKGIISLVNLIIENAVKEGASDIHVEPEETNVRVRYRIDGILYNREALPLKTQAALSSRIKLLSQMNIAERRLPQDGRIRGRHGGKDVDIRVSTIPSIYGESIVMRILDREASFISLERLGFDPDLLARYETLISKPYGMLLITGPTGSGKTTTLYASLDRINSADKKIITVEEPVEYMLRGITQIHVRPKIGLTFASGLRHIVRQDPDIIMVGEIRDLETARIGIHASLTGHLLLSTLHTNDAPSAIARLIDMGVEHYLVSSTLMGVMAQRLVRRICPDCTEMHPVPEEMRAELGDDLTTVPRGRGCPRCMQTGYRGRVAIFELLVISDAISDLITSRAPAREIKEKAVAEGMRTLHADGIEKVKQGLTTLEEVFRVTQVEG